VIHLLRIHWNFPENINWDSWPG